MSDILITPNRGTSNAPTIQFSGSVNASASIRLEVLPEGQVAFMGRSGSLFSISDSLQGSLMAVSDISGLPILEVFSDDRVVMGKFNTNALVVTGSDVGIGKVPRNAKLDVSGSVVITGSLNTTGNVTVSGGTVGTAASTNLTLAGGSTGASLVLGQGANGAATLDVKGTGLLNITTQNVAGENTALQITHGNGTSGNILGIQFLARGPGNGIAAIKAVGFTGPSSQLKFFTMTANVLSEAGMFTGAGNLLIGGTTDITGTGGLKVFGTTASTSTTTGALQVAGGVGVAGALFTGANVTMTNGNLMISGSSTPMLAVRGSSTTAISHYINSFGTGRVGVSSLDMFVGGSTGMGTLIQANAANVIYINTSENVGIGKTTPINAKLDVSGSATITGSLNATVYTETKSSPTISAGTLTLLLNTANVFTVSLNANITTFNLNSLPAGAVVYSLVLQFTADGTARAVTWPASVKWPGGAAPTLTSTLNKVDTFVLMTPDSGTTFFGFVSAQNS